MDISQIAKCDMSSCAYNTSGLCRTLAITVGPHAECHTYNHGSSKGGFKETKGGIGACLASDCKFNDRLECAAPNVNVASHDRHADCETFQPRR